MAAKSKKLLFTFLTILVVIVWGTTFASSKTLIDSGMDTIDILFLSFIIAYLSALAVSHKKLWSDNLKDELIHAACGLVGGAGYYLTQVEALKYTFTTNVSILISAAPIITAILSYFIFRERLSTLKIIGTAIGLLGAVLVVFNGNFELDINPTGNLLSIAAAVAWATYSILLKILGEKYDVTFTIRKVFFYGILGLIAYSFSHPLNIHLESLASIKIAGNLVYLGLISSMICYIIWGKAVNILGPTKTANFMYILPFATLFVGYILLNEKISIVSIVGLVAIIAGVYLTERTSASE